MGKNKDLSKINELIDSIKSRGKTVYPLMGRLGYKEGPGKYHFLGKPYIKLMRRKIYETKDLDNYGRGQVLRLATDLMAEGCKDGNINIAILGFRLYDSLGLANRTSVKNRLVKAMEKAKNPSVEEIDEAKTLLDFSEHMKKEKNSIENKVLTSIFGIATAIGILFGINSLTGAAIGFSNAPSGFLGAVLFIGGIVGLYFSLK